DAPLDLADAVVAQAVAGVTLLVDCLSLWVSNEMLRLLGPEADVERLSEAGWARLGDRLAEGTEGVVAAARDGRAGLVLVSNEVGMGLVPPYPLGRRYRDLLGRVNQAAAARAEDVHLLVA